MSPCRLLTLARDALAAIKPRSLDEVAAAIWDRAYTTMQTSVVPVPHSRRPEDTAERPAPTSSGAGHLNLGNGPWATVDLTDDWWLKGDLPGGIVDRWGVIIGRCGSLKMAEDIVKLVNFATT